MHKAILSNSNNLEYLLINLLAYLELPLINEAKQ